MYAIIETGGKQYRVEEGSKIKVEKLAVAEGAEVVLDKVLLVAGAGEPQVGAPYVGGAKVVCQAVAHGRGKKLIIFHKWRRNDSHKKTGHRQDYTALTIKAIQV